MNPLAHIGMWARRGFGRIVPDPFVIAVGLTIIVFAFAVVSGARPAAMAAVWGRTGAWSLLAFTMQMGLMLMLGSALADAPVFRRAIERAAGLAWSPRSLVGLTALWSIALAVLNWSLGLIGGALIARAAGRLARARGWEVHFPLVCAAGYAGLMVWHGGFSGSAPLKSASEAGMVEIVGPSLAAKVGAVPIADTLLGPLNLWVTGGLIVLGPLVFMGMCPPRGADPHWRAAPDTIEERVDAGDVSDDGASSGWLDRFERSSWSVLLLAGLIASAVLVQFVERGLEAFDFNAVNLGLWALCLLAYRRPAAFMRACERAIGACAAIVVQFPLYAGIMGIMAAAGLSTWLSEWFAAAGRESFLLVSFVSAGLLNVFVPSGGGQWAVQGPVLLQANLELGLPPGDVVMAMAYGDQWTNMLQPFWALPLLALTGVRARDIVGYTSIWMVCGGLWIAGVLAGF